MGISHHASASRISVSHHRDHWDPQNTAELPLERRLSQTSLQPRHPWVVSLSWSGYGVGSAPETQQESFIIAWAPSEKDHLIVAFNYCFSSQSDFLIVMILNIVVRRPPLSASALPFPSPSLPHSLPPSLPPLPPSVGFPFLPCPSLPAAPRTAPPTPTPPLPTPPLGFRSLPAPLAFGCPDFLIYNVCPPSPAAPPHPLPHPRLPSVPTPAASDLAGNAQA